MKTSKEIYPEERRTGVYGQYSPELDECIDALRSAEHELEEVSNRPAWQNEVLAKKPLYTNSYGTEFFEGDENWYVHTDRIDLRKNDPIKEGYGYDELEYVSEALKDREQCLLWIRDNIHRIR